MTTLTLSPLSRSIIGFDHLGRSIDQYFTDGYPPYNIEKKDDNVYSLSLAVAGFSIDDIDITVNENTLTIKGESKSQVDNKDKVYLYRSIADTRFERTFQLADHIFVSGAQLGDGMLHIDLVREVPEHKKPRRIEISGSKLTGQKTNA